LHDSWEISAAVAAAVEEVATCGTTTIEDRDERRNAQIAERKGTTKKRIVWNYRLTKDDARRDGNQSLTE
jgi:hypothetical protein